jgi:hypothetical protein
MAKYLAAAGGGAGGGWVVGNLIGKRKEQGNDPLIYRRGAVDGYRYAVRQMAMRNQAAAAYNQMQGG